MFVLGRSLDLWPAAGIPEEPESGRQHAGQHGGREAEQVRVEDPVHRQREHSGNGDTDNHDGGPGVDHLDADDVHMAEQVQHGFGRDGDDGDNDGVGDGHDDNFVVALVIQEPQCPAGDDDREGGGGGGCGAGVVLLRKENALVGERGPRC